MLYFKGLFKVVKKIQFYVNPRLAIATLNVKTSCNEFVGPCVFYSRLNKASVEWTLLINNTLSNDFYKRLFKYIK
jgi:hypothetical protein